MNLDLTLNMSQKVLILDIETSPLEVYVWGTKDQFVSLDQIKRDWFILAFSAKWLNDKSSKIVYEDVEGHKWGDDKNLLKTVWKLLDEADIVITQNGERFDSRKLNARFILAGMPPPRPYRHIDTYKLLNKVAEFTSHSLEYLTANINTKYKKLKHKKYPGWKLWSACLANTSDAWKEMRRYNTHDVLSTEELYLKVRGWTPTKFPDVVLNPTRCPVCGCLNAESRGFTFTKSYKAPRFRCLNCGKWRVGTKVKREDL